MQINEKHMEEVKIKYEKEKEYELRIIKIELEARELRNRTAIELRHKEEMHAIERRINKIEIAKKIEEK